MLVFSGTRYFDFEKLKKAHEDYKKLKGTPSRIKTYSLERYVAQKLGKLAGEISLEKCALAMQEYYIEHGELPVNHPDCRSEYVTLEEDIDIDYLRRYFLEKSWSFSAIDGRKVDVSTYQSNKIVYAYVKAETFEYPSLCDCSN